MTSEKRIKELADEHTIGGRQAYGVYPFAFARAIEAECQKVPDGYVPVPVEPTAFLIEGFDGNGKRVAAVIQQNADNARNSASVFAEHYPSVKTSGLYLAPPDQSAEAQREINMALDLDDARERIAELERQQTKLVPLSQRELNPGYRCAKCNNDFPTTAGSKFRWLGNCKP